MSQATSSIALITGGNRGLGKNAALALAAQGVDVILTYRNNGDEAQSVVAGIQAQGRKAVALQLDVGVVASFPGFVEQLRDALDRHWQRGHFNYLFNNAGTGLHAMFHETTEADFDELVNVHFKGVFFLTQALLPLIADGGRILNVSSGLARFSLPGSSAYACVKGAVEVLTRYLAKELGSRGIAVNTLAPGAIATDFRDAAVRNNPELQKMIAAQTALGRVGEADDIGGLVATLFSSSTGWVNAQRIEASGGMFI
ncbi:SDR family NAD(P)-dependent oxidoreductase [Dyella sp.]|uniref:SDR family NAD(P)-dependent oxidoreductase n=1 Tax=Dyella sp. TaxID=1869338 RepID=UPI002ED655EB